MYGSRFADLWASANPADVRVTWAEGLAYVSGDELAGALRACLLEYPYPPTLPQFAILCRAQKRQEMPRLSNDVSGPIDPAVMAQALKLAANTKNGKKNPRDWARRILKRAESGERLCYLSVPYAREALYLAPVEREPGSDDEEVAA